MKEPKHFRSTHPTLRHVCVGLLITAGLVGAKILFERSEIGHRVELLTFELLQGRLTEIDTDPLPVVVLDISAIPTATADRSTPRTALRDLIEVLINGNKDVRLKAIGIDIDFSPSLQGPQSPEEDLEFLNYCLDERNKVPIYLGVHRTIGLTSNTWLGHEDYVPIAAAIYAEEGHVSRLPVTFKTLGSNDVLPSFAAALASAYRQESLPTPRWWIRPFVSSSHEKKIPLKGIDRSVLVSERLINYSKLELFRQTAVPTRDAAGIAQILELLNNKVVIIGRVRDTTDHYTVPGHGQAAGVFLHANAVHTFIKEPLFELSLGFRLALDFLISLLIIFLVARVRYSNPEVSPTEWHRRQKKYTYVAGFVIFLAGLFLVQYASVMWLDFVPLIVALVLHPWIEKNLETVMRRKSVAADQEVEVTS